jgi:hypothetical protein
MSAPNPYINLYQRDEDRLRDIGLAAAALDDASWTWTTADEARAAVADFIGRLTNSRDPRAPVPPPSNGVRQ